MGDSDRETRIDDLRMLYESARNMLEDGESSKSLSLKSVGIQCFISNRHLQSLEVADFAIGAFQQAMEFIPPDDDELLLFLFRALGEALLERYKLSRDIEDINHAISAIEKSIELSSKDSLSPVSGDLTNLGVALHTRFERTEDLRDNADAIELLRTAAALEPDGDQSRLMNLSTCLQHRFNHTHDLNIIDEAIEVNQRLVNSVHIGHPSYSVSLTNSASAFMSRFEYSGDHQDIVRAIEAQQKAVDHTPSDSPDSLSGCLVNLGSTYQAYFIHAGDLSHINLAVDFHRQGLSLAAADDYRLPDFLLNLGVSLGYRFLATGERSDLEEAISFEQQAIQMCNDDDPKLRYFYSDLGNLFYYRTNLTHDPLDIYEGVNAHREGVLRTPTGHKCLPGLLNNLGNSLISLFSITNKMSHLNDAVSNYKEAVRITVDGDIELMNHLNNLGNGLCRRFMNTHEKCDLVDGLDALRQSVILCPSNHAKLANNLANLADALRILFESEHRPEILDEAISVVDRAINLTSEGHARYPSLLDRLAALFFTRYSATNSNDDVENAVSLYRQATLIPIGTPSLRLRSGMRWGTISSSRNPEEAMEAFGIIFDDIVPQLAWIGRTMKQRYSQLTTLADIVSVASAVAIAYEQLHIAIEWLEQGRSIVWNQINTFRTPLDELGKVDPSLRKELEYIADALQGAGMRQLDESSDFMPTMAHKVSIQNDVRRHQELANRWDSLLSEIRTINGFENFLRPMPFFELIRVLPPSGLVVVINAHSVRCDALVLTRGMSAEGADLFRVCLPNFYERATIIRERLHILLSESSIRTRSTRTGRLASRSKMQFSLKKILRELWYEVVKPIIDSLELKPNMPDFPRIWWCPTGPLAFLPLHAAGDYNNPNSGSNITDYAISSYTPTITTLTQGLSRYNQRQAQGLSTSFKGLLFVSEPEAPSLPPIPSTTQEAQIIRECFGTSPSLAFQNLDGRDATVDNVLHAMPLYSWIHLSCHALQGDIPLKSAFFLHDGPLSLGEIIRQPLPDAEFAYLSACETSKGDKELSEEAVHLAGGMLAAGYTSVVATMWSISDEYAPLVAEAFYSGMILTEEGRESGEFKPDCTRSAAALHRAIKCFRDRVGDDEEGLLLWVPYMHVGI